MTSWFTLPVFLATYLFTIVHLPIEIKRCQKIILEMKLFCSFSSFNNLQILIYTYFNLMDVDSDHCSMKNIGDPYH